jgi:nucleotidyltransferase/DNA polymerase involved in DNA repair
MAAATSAGTLRETGLPTATLVAKSIRQQIWEELNLTASAGVAPNKLLAKIASDWRKPNGQFVIQPHEVQAFLLTLPVGRITGAGKVTEACMAQAGIKFVGDIHAMKLDELERAFGSYTQRLHKLARGIDHNPVGLTSRNGRLACASEEWCRASECLHVDCLPLSRHTARAPDDAKHREVRNSAHREC